MRAAGNRFGVSPWCLLETGGRCCSSFVAFRGSCGTDSKVPAAGRCQLCLNRRSPARASTRYGSKEDRARTVHKQDVLDAPATLAARIRVLATKRSNKNNPNDAHSIAIAALRAPALRLVESADHAEVVRLLSQSGTGIWAASGLGSSAGCTRSWSRAIGLNGAQRPPGRVGGQTAPLDRATGSARPTRSKTPAGEPLTHTQDVTDVGAQALCPLGSASKTPDRVNPGAALAEPCRRKFQAPRNPKQKVQGAGPRSARARSGGGHKTCLLDVRHYPSIP